MRQIEGFNERPNGTPTIQPDGKFFCHLQPFQQELRSSLSDGEICPLALPNLHDPDFPQTQVFQEHHFCVQSVSRVGQRRKNFHLAQNPD
jgi:hypothetical protein